jgi:hypothetical protein
MGSTHRLDQPQICLNRQDDRGFWNFCKAWHWYLLHLGLCVAFFEFMVTLVDGHAFRIGNPTYFIQRESGLYQAEVTGFVSAALVVLRLVAEVGSSLIIWRLVFLLLGKTGITLVELCRVVDMRLPMLSGFRSRKLISWSLFGVIIVVLVWPSSIAAPLANSSLQWIPSTQLAHSKVRDYTIPAIQNPGEWLSFLYPFNMMEIALRAAIMGVKDSDYAFIATPGTQRQYLYLNPHLPSSSLITAEMPYFEVSNISWRNAEFRPKLESPNDLRNASMQKEAPNARLMGTLGFWKRQNWTYSSAIDLYSQTPTVYEGKKNVSVLVGRIQPCVDTDAEVDSGTSKCTSPSKFNADAVQGTNSTKCLFKTRKFGQLPLGVSHYSQPQYLNDEWAASDCYIVAEVSMRIGITAKQDTNITLVGASEDLHSASPLHRANQSQSALTSDWATLPTLDMMTDVLQELVWLEVGQQYQRDNVDGYLKGMLTVAYHATRSALVHQIADSKTTISATPSEPIVRASVNRGRLYGWLGLNACLTLSAMLLWTVQSVTAKSSKTVRDPTLVALTTNMDAVCHYNGDGLCNAVALQRGDNKLGRVVWDHELDGACRKLRFAGQGEVDGAVQTGIPLLSLRRYNKIPDQ